MKTDENKEGERVTEKMRLPRSIKSRQGLKSLSTKKRNQLKESSNLFITINSNK